MVDSNLELVSFGCDWITAVANEPESSGNLLESAAMLLHTRSQLGFKVRGWGMAGFSGFATSGVQFGERNNEAIVRLSSDVAHDYWRDFYALANTVTRFDLELTTRSDELAKRRVTRAYKQARRHCDGAPGHPNVTIISSTRGGTTCYLGQRVSDAYGRIYDKGAEAQTDAWSNCVRHELEMKKVLAAKCSADLFRSPSPQHTTISVVQGFFSRRGCPIPGFSANKSYSTYRPPTDTERQIRWLRNQVRPTVASLCDLNLLQIVLDNLGLSDKVLTYEECRKRSSPANETEV